MDVDDLLSSTDLPEVSVNTDDVLVATVRRGRARRQRRSFVRAAFALLVVGGLAAAAMSIANRDDAGHVSTGPTADAGQISGAWRRMAESPLGPRDQGIAVWTGTEVVVAGGSSTPPCPADADCLVDLEPLADGAAYNPTRDTWRPIADAPRAFVRGEAIWTGTDVLVLAEVRGEPDMLWAYDPRADSWARRADPPQNGFRNLAWTGESWAGITSHGSRDETGWRYQPDTDTWSALPADPLGDLSDRSLVWTGTDVVLLGGRYDQKGAPPNGLWEAAALNGDESWRRLPASGIYNNGGAWSALDGLVVNPGTGRSGEFDTGGVFNPDRGKWTPLPSDDDMARGGRTAYAGPAGRWVVDDDRLLDPAAREWHRIEGRPDDVTPAVAAWTGTEIITWGGTILHESGSPELVATGLAYRPPGEAATTPKPDEPEPSTTGPSHTPEPGDAAVWFVDPDAPPTPSTSTFTAQVSRLGCNSGVTGKVQRPGVVFTDTEVVVAFTVEPDPDGGNCPTNDRVPYEVQLGQPIGDRVLVDGACSSGGEAATTSYCDEDRGVRWRG